MHVNSKQKKARVATHIEEKIDVKSRTVSIEKEGLYILIRVTSIGRYKNYICIQHQST